MRHFEMKRTIIKENPIAEITLRKYEKPYRLKDRELVRKLCLSIGLLQPGDSRDVIVDVLHALLRERKEMNSGEIRSSVIASRKQNNLPVAGVAQSNIRRQLKRLRDIYIVEKNSGTYRIAENLSLNEIVLEKLEKLLVPQIMERVKEYFAAVGREFGK